MIIKDVACDFCYPRATAQPAVAHVEGKSCEFNSMAGPYRLPFFKAYCAGHQVEAEVWLRENLSFCAAADAGRKAVVTFRLVGAAELLEGLRRAKSIADDIVNSLSSK